jgi:cytochrome c551/c552
MVGPSLKDVSEDAGEDIEGMSAEEYIRQSIVDPGAYLVEDFSNVMPPYNTLSDSDLNDLVAYLLSLK